jgi:hypothetical protein
MDPYYMNKNKILIQSILLKNNYSLFNYKYK